MISLSIIYTFSGLVLLLMILTVEQDENTVQDKVKFILICKVSCHISLLFCKVSCHISLFKNIHTGALFNWKTAKPVGNSPGITSLSFRSWYLCDIRCRVTWKNSCCEKYCRIDMISIKSEYTVLYLILFIHVIVTFKLCSLKKLIWKKSEKF